MSISSNPGAEATTRAPRTATCDDCGTAVPASDRLCPACSQRRLPAPAGRTLVHWLVLVAVLAALFGAGAYLNS